MACERKPRFQMMKIVHTMNRPVSIRHGMTPAMQVPLRIETSPDEMTVSGKLTLRQTDFGIAPLSVLGGAIQVKDAVDLSFRMHARPLE